MIPKGKENRPLVSIVIPVYNGASYIEETASSIFKSVYRNFEVILIDDGSKDTSKKICKALSRKYKRVRFFDSVKNTGMGRCLNLAISKAKGKYIARINQDDIIMPDRLERQVSFLEKNQEYVAVGGAIQLFDQKNANIDIVQFPLTDEAIRKQWLLLSPFSDPTVMYRKKAFYRTEQYQQSFWPADDVMMWYQLGRQGKLANFKTVLTKVRWHADAGSIKFHKIQIKKTFKAHLWAGEHIERPTRKVWLFWIGQLSAGMIFPPRFNWYVFRLLRKIQSGSLSFSSIFMFLKKLIKKDKKIVLQSNKVAPSIIR